MTPTMETYKRVAVSCTRCRSLKLKCFRKGDVGSPCDRCLRQGFACKTSRIKQSRPYYQTCKEQYELLETIVHHFLPGVSLEKSSLQNAVSNLAKQDRPRLDTEDVVNCTGQIGMAEQSLDNDLLPLDSGAALFDEKAMPSSEVPAWLLLSNETTHTSIVAEAACPASLDSAGHSSNSICLESAMSEERGMSSEEIRIWVDNVMAQDAMHVPRSHSGTSFLFFCSEITKSSLKHASRAMPCPWDPPPESTLREPLHPLHLPKQASVAEFGRIFFAQLNNCYYVLSFEEFNAHLEAVYSSGQRRTNADLAIIHWIACLKDHRQELFQDALNYGNACVEEGTIASVKALMIMTLVCLWRNRRNTAWISVGSAVRVAQSLGIHLHESSGIPASASTIEGRKRLWWSLFDLNTTIAAHLGQPLGLSISSCRVSHPEELEFDHVPFSPGGLAKASAELAILLHQCIENLYGQTKSVFETMRITDSLVDQLQSWWEAVPPYLKPDCPMPPSSVRAIANLSLKYHYTIMLITRPYLLKLAGANSTTAVEITRLASICISSNDQSITLLKLLCDQNMISNINYFDSYHILSNGIYLYLRAVANGSSQTVAKIENYMPLLRFVAHRGIGLAFKQTISSLWKELKSPNIINNNPHSDVGIPLELGKQVEEDYLMASWTSSDSWLNPMAYYSDLIEI